MTLLCVAHINGLETNPFKVNTRSHLPRTFMKISQNMRVVHICGYARVF